MKTRQHRPPGRWRRWAVRGALAIAALLAVVAIALAVVLASLDRPWLKARLRRTLSDRAGIQLDYRALKLRPFSGLWLDGLVIATPEPLRALTPELARIDHLEAVWSLSSLLGRGPKIPAVAIDGVAVAVAQDAAGRTSLDLVGPPRNRDAREPATPLSRLTAQIFSGPAPVGRLDVTRVQAAFVRADAGGGIQRDVIAGFQLNLSTRPVAGGWAATAGAGAPGAPLLLDVARQGPSAGGARLALALRVSGDPQALGLGVDLRVVRQDLVPLRVNQLLQVEAAIKPDAPHGETAIRLDRLAAADGALLASLRADLSDAGGRLSIAAADATVDLARMLGVVPRGTVPVTLEAGRVQVHLAQLQVGGGPPRLAPAGTARLDLQLTRARLPLPGGAVAVSGLRVGLAAQPAADDRWQGEVTLRIDGADLTRSTRLSLRRAQLALRAQAVRIDPASPAASAGTVKVDGDVLAADLRTPALRGSIDDLGLRLGATFSGQPPYGADLQVPIAGLRLFDGRGRRLLATPARIAVLAAHVVPDAQRPIASRGDVRIDLELGTSQASVAVHKRADDVDLDIALKAASLAAARPFLPPELASKLDWERIAVDLQTKARVQRLAAAAPSLRQETSLRVDGLRSGRTGARRLVLLARSSGDARRHQADLSLSTEGMAIEGRAAPDARLNLTATVDRGQPSAKVHLDLDGGAHLALDASVGFAAGPRRLDADVDLRADRLILAGALHPFVPALTGIDLRRAAVRVQAHAGLTGLVERAGRGGELRLARDAARTAGGTADLTVHVPDLAVTEGATQVGLGALDWKVGLRGGGARRELSSDLHVDRLRFASGELHVDVAALQDAASARVDGDPVAGPAQLTNQLVLTGLRQDLAPPIATDQITLALTAQREADQSIRISDLRLTDPNAGAALSLRGAVDFGTDRRLSVRGRFDQDLSKLRQLPSAMTASGRLGLSFGVDSPDLEVFRTRAGLELDNVAFRAPAMGVAVETADAKIPIDLRVQLGPNGLEIPRDVRANPYASLRFADQGPLQAHSSFLSIARLTTPIVTVAPLAGNLSIDQNVLSLGQLEMGVRGGRVTGRCVLDWRGDDAKIEAHIRATGVQSSHGEPFDGDAALVVSTAERSIEGRAQILRIGKRHLLDLLDLQDPHHVDPAMNRIRHAMLLGYPDQVRIAFNHGFASARVTLGGLARLIRIDEIRGIPTGSLLDKVLTSPSRSEEK